MSLISKGKVYELPSFEYIVDLVFLLNADADGYWQDQVIHFKLNATLRDQCNYDLIGQTIISGWIMLSTWTLNASWSWDIH